LESVLKNIPRRISEEAGDEGGGCNFGDPLPYPKIKGEGPIFIFVVALSK